MSTKKKLIESTMFTRRGIYSNIDYTQNLCRLRWTLDLYILKNNTPVTKELLEKNGFQWGLTSDEQDQEALMNMSFEKGYVYDDAEIEIKFQKCGDELCGIMYARDKEGYCSSIMVNIKTIADLEDALDLCGIDKEIEL